MIREAKPVRVQGRGGQTDRARLRLRTEPVPVSGADRSVGSADRVVLPMEMRHLLPNANATTR